MTQKNGLCGEIYQGVFATPSPRLCPHMAPWSLTVGHCGGFLQPTVVLLETTESPAQQRGNQQGLELHRALPLNELRITFCKLLAGWVYFSLFLRWAIIWQVTGSVSKT